MSQLFEPSRALSKEARIKNMCEYKELCIQADEDFEGYANLWFGRAREHMTDLRWENWLKEIKP